MKNIKHYLAPGHTWGERIGLTILGIVGILVYPLYLLKKKIFKK